MSFSYPDSAGNFLQDYDDAHAYEFNAGSFAGQHGFDSNGFPTPLDDLINRQQDQESSRHDTESPEYVYGNPVVGTVPSTTVDLRHLMLPSTTPTSMPAISSFRPATQTFSAAGRIPTLAAPAFNAAASNFNPALGDRHVGDHMSATFEVPAVSAPMTAYDATATTIPRFPPTLGEPDLAFWSMWERVVKLNGDPVFGTNMELLHSDDPHVQNCVKGGYAAWRRANSPLSNTAFAAGQAQEEYGSDQGSVEVAPDRRRAELQPSNTVDAAHYGQQELAGVQASADEVTACNTEEGPSVAKGAVNQESSIASPQDAKTEEARKTIISFKGLPAFTPSAELNNATACREYLAYIDPSLAHSVEIKNDDWREVQKSRISEFTNLVRAALPQHYAPNPSTFPAPKMPNYHSQQTKAEAKVIEQLQTPVQLKTAEARCHLLVDAAVAVHERGVYKETFDQYQEFKAGGHQPKGPACLNLDSVCSARITKMIGIIAANKLVAEDVLEGKNFHTFAQDPDAYLKGKIDYLKSNTRRQNKTDEAKAAKPVKATKAKATRAKTTTAKSTKATQATKRKAADAGLDDDYEEGGSEDEEPVAKKRG